MARLPNPAVRQRWSRLIQLHHQSNLTVADFCGSQSISIASFYAWRRKMREPLEQDGEFLAVQINHPLEPLGPLALAKVCFPCGTQIEIDSRDSQSLLLVVDRLSPRLTEAAK